MYSLQFHSILNGLVTVVQAKITKRFGILTSGDHGIAGWSGQILTNLSSY